MKIDQELIKNDRDSSIHCMRDLHHELGFYMHAHAEYELVLIETGHGHRFIGDAVHIFGAGDLVLLPPQMPHSWKAPASQEGYEVVCFQFHEHWINDSFAKMPECDRILSFLKNADRALSFAAEDTGVLRARMLEVDMQNPFQRWLCLMQCLYGLSLLAAAQMISSQVYRGSKSVLYDENKINEICNHLLKNYDQIIIQEEVAKRFKMSNSSLSRFFKKHTGQTFTAYLHELRIIRACELLLYSDIAIAEIACQSGFNNISQFNRIFIRLRYISPRAYRKQFV